MRWWAVLSRLALCCVFSLTRSAFFAVLRMSQWKPPTPKSPTSTRLSDKEETAPAVSSRTGDGSDRLGEKEKPEEGGHGSCRPPPSTEIGQVKSVRQLLLGRRRLPKTKTAPEDRSTLVQRGKTGQEEEDEEKEEGNSLELGGVFERPLRYGDYMQKCCDLRLQMDGIGKLR